MKPTVLAVSNTLAPIHHFVRDMIFVNWSKRRNAVISNHIIIHIFQALISSVKSNLRTSKMRQFQQIVVIKMFQMTQGHQKMRQLMQKIVAIWTFQMS
jgi:hypothetical protein